MLDIVFRNSFNGQEWPQVFFEKIVLCAIEELHWQNKAVEISISLVGEDKIRTLNKTYRNKDAVTDVLSFPLGDVPEVLAPHLPLGDIFICLPKAVHDAEQENMPLKKKLAWLTIHGFLHLAGYDHERSEKYEKEMFDLEKKILEKCGIPVNM